MENRNNRLIRDLYDARTRNDFDAVRSILAEDVVWHEPQLESEFTGDLHGPDAVLDMIREAQKLTGGTFRLVPREVFANGEHAVALVDWSATREGKTLEGKEVAVYRVRGGKVVEASFHQDDARAEEALWERDVEGVEDMDGGVGGEFCILRAGLEHADLVAPLFDAYRRFYGQPADLQGAREFLGQRLAEGSSVVFLAAARGGEEPAPVGFMQLYPSFSSVSMQRTWILNDLFVAPDARKKGIGKALLEKAKAFAEGAGAKRLELKTGVSNIVAQSLYESLDWKREEGFFTYSLALRNGS